MRTGGSGSWEGWTVIDADEVCPGEVISTVLVGHPDGARVELLVGFQQADGEDGRARFTVPATAGVRAGDPVRVVRRPDGVLRLARSGAPQRRPARWWPPPDLRTGAWGLAVLLVAAVLVAGLAWVAVRQRTTVLPTTPPTASQSAGGAPGSAGPSTSDAPGRTAGPSDSEPPYEPGR